jgi:hypothetical protein
METGMKAENKIIYGPDGFIKIGFFAVWKEMTVVSWKVED